MTKNMMQKYKITAGNEIIRAYLGIINSIRIAHIKKTILSKERRHNHILTSAVAQHRLWHSSSFFSKFVVNEQCGSGDLAG
jgi:hypothetical protein